MRRDDGRASGRPENLHWQVVARNHDQSVGGAVPHSHHATPLALDHEPAPLHVDGREGTVALAMQE